MVNPSGQFLLGGPAADAGLTGRKIIVDTYGGIARHGGGAFSGKDPSKVDRSAAYAARHVAKNLVAAGLADRCEVQVSYAIGRAHPTSIAVETFGTGTVSEEEMLELVRRHFDLRPGAIIANMKLMRPIYRPTAAYGHFGRDDLGVAWELTDRVEAMRADASVAAQARQLVQRTNSAPVVTRARSLRLRVHDTLTERKVRLAPRDQGAASRSSPCTCAGSRRTTRATWATPSPSRCSTSWCGSSRQTGCACATCRTSPTSTTRCSSGRGATGSTGGCWPTARRRSTSAT